MLDTGGLDWGILNDSRCQNSPPPIDSEKLQQAAVGVLGVVSEMSVPLSEKNTDKQLTTSVEREEYSLTSPKDGREAIFHGLTSGTDIDDTTFDTALEAFFAGVIQKLERTEIPFLDKLLVLILGEKTISEDDFLEELQKVPRGIDFAKLEKEIEKKTNNTDKNSQNMKNYRSALDKFKKQNQPELYFEQDYIGREQVRKDLQASYEQRKQKLDD